MKTTKTGIILAIAAAAAFSTASFAAGTTHQKSEVKCVGGNSCRGKSACKTATNSCSGQNSCKAKGFVMAKDAKECAKKGGKVE